MVPAKGIHEGKVGGVGSSEGEVGGAGSSECEVGGAGSRRGRGHDVTVMIEGRMDSQGEEFESK